MKHTFPFSLLLLLSTSVSPSMLAAPPAAASILQIRHSITDDNIIAPESFETQTRQLEESFYLKNYVYPESIQAIRPRQPMPNTKNGSPNCPPS